MSTLIGDLVPGEMFVLDREEVCVNCKFWKRLFVVTQNEFQSTSVFDRYFFPEDIEKHVSGEFTGKQSKIGSCTCDKFIYGENEDTPDNGLSYTDSEEYSAQLRTGENFGCIHWEVKP